MLASPLNVAQVHNKGHKYSSISERCTKDGNAVVPLPSACLSLGVQPAWKHRNSEASIWEYPWLQAKKKSHIHLQHLLKAAIPSPRSYSEPLWSQGYDDFCILWVSDASLIHLTTGSLYHRQGFGEGLTFHIVSARFPYHWAGSGITYQQMLVLNVLTSLPLCQGSNTKWGSPRLFTYRQNRTLARKKNKFAEGGCCMCDSGREITPRTPTVLSSDLGIRVAQLILGTMLLLLNK